MAESQIILLPKVDYFKWVRAAQKYALTFGVNITPEPIKTAGSEIVTVAIPENGYPDEGDITIWIKARYPNTIVDAIFARSPEELQTILEQRAARNARFGEEDLTPRSKALPKYRLDRLYLFWPTDYETITQRFAANPEIYAKWGLHGHEGIDIRAPKNARVYACAPGEVVMVEIDPGAHAYGRHVRIRHEGGYKTVYGHLGEITVVVGQQVNPRDVIGFSDPDVSFLHLSLKKEGVTEQGLSNYPGDIIDPTPFLVFPHQEAEVCETLGLDLEPLGDQNYPWTRPCLVGLNGRIGGTMQEVDLSILRTAKIEAIKLPVQTPDSTLSQLRQLVPDLFIMARLSPPEDRVALHPSIWLQAMSQEVLRLYNQGVRYFEILESPNLNLYGLGKEWFSGSGFASWWLKVSNGLREVAPEGRFGFPGLSPGQQISGQRMDAKVFLDQADPALLEADWIGVNCFWMDASEMDMADHGRLYKYYRERFPDKLLFITEFGNVNQLSDPYGKGREYVDYYHSLRNEPGIGAAYAQVISSASGYDSLVWRTEDGKLNNIPTVVGKRKS